MSPSPQPNLVVIRSSEIERAVKFYNILGLAMTRHAHGSGPEHYAAEVNGFVFEIYPATAKSLPTTGTRIGFKVNSVDELIAKLSQMGSVIISPLADSEWGRRAVVKDFDGHTVELIESK